MTTTFTDLGVSDPIIDALASRNIDAPFHIQALVMEDALEGADILASSRTGSGKTLAFAIPVVERIQVKSGIAGLVLVPTRELASQVAIEFESIAKAKNLRVAAVYGGVSLPAQAKRAARAHIIVATPGRLEDLAQQKLIDLSKVEILVLDEADRMLDMGFQPQIAAIVRRIPKDRQTMFFSATLDGDVGRIAVAYTRDAKRHHVESAAPTVEEAEHRFVNVASADKTEALLKLLEEKGQRRLIFVKTKRGADRLAAKLHNSGIKAVAMHGDLTQGARERALAGFTKGRYDTLVATDVAARGIDLDDITQVINYDPPEDHKAYIHRVGRTARAGRTGMGITFVTTEQQGDVSRIASILKLRTEYEEAGLKVAAPRLAYTSGRGGRSNMARRRRRGF
ncbi:MAG TPA: DEAD/DEAH box helicase [Actinomycetota bacterium]|nr:DEAD/DEAH box helicase [Actinomycetota bacterium]